MQTYVRSLIRFHHRLYGAMAVGLVAAALAPSQWHVFERALFGWNVGLWLYLILLWTMMYRAESASRRVALDSEDESASTVLVTTCVAALASIAAIVFELGTAHSAADAAQKALHLALSGFALIGAWTLLPTAFTVYYARLFYMHHSWTDASMPRSGEGIASPAKSQLPLRFPDDKSHPDYVDFAYFAFTIAVAAQTSDVAVADSATRRFTLIQSVLAFFFNLAILGLSVNVAASLLS
ncbi:DUF1345 domain-containing protein [Robbsia sp. KACC 23696]|uniref:DUF1345 domain-containing protein n=1 Tax=Robbsia sp. KACC 23696 TaxID=3149231 RepID=UPI00325AF049